MIDDSSVWVEGQLIGGVLRQTARNHPHRDALVFPRLDPNGKPRPAGATATAADARHSSKSCYRLTYRQLDDEVDRVAAGLLGLGIRRGDHVAVWATNWPRWVLLQFATARVGAVLVTINPSYRSGELGYVLKQSEARALFLVERFRQSDYFAMLRQTVPDLSGSTPGTAHSTEYPGLEHVVSMSETTAGGLWSWDAFCRKGESLGKGDLARREAELEPGDAINIQYTSGTTGFPKGAMLTHRNLLLNAYYTGDCQRITEADRIGIPVPFYHCFGCVLGVLCAAVRGAAIIVPEEHFDPGATLAAVESERATSIYGVPTMFIGMLEHPSFPKRNLKSLRTGIMAGSPCPVEIMKRVVEDMGAREVTIAYGLTEASPVITMTNTQDPVDLRVRTVGRPIPGVEVKLVDPGTGATLGNDEQGELCARGHNVMLGYYNLPDETRTAIDADGWLHTGDLSLRMPNGYYRITGRIKDMICRGGENIYPREIEELMFTHPAIADVAVVGIPDPKYVEDVVAWIKLKPGASTSKEEIRAYCKERMAHYKVPRHIRFVDEFPQTVTGKIQKFKIREIMMNDLNIQATETA